jgi:hypothetical protein
MRFATRPLGGVLSVLDSKRFNQLAIAGVVQLM